MYGISHLAMIPCRAEPSGKSELVTQLLFGEHYTVLEEKGEWLKIQNAYDSYLGWISLQQFFPIKENTFTSLQSHKPVLTNKLIQFLHDKENEQLFPVGPGCVLPFFTNKHLILENKSFAFEGEVESPNEKIDVSALLGFSNMFLNAPYLWGGKTPFGIDCSGFTQLVYRLCGLSLPRDAWQQAELGTALSFVEESEPGDLAFFDNEEGKIVHVGIITGPGQLIHASGKVRCDAFDHYGIFHSERKKYTHHMRVIKRIIP